MPKRKEEQRNPLMDAISEIERNNPEFSKEQKEIVDIITFCDAPMYLNLPGNNFYLWVSQRTILKAFYIGTRGNENLTLTQEEWAWLYENENDEEIDGMLYEKNIKDVIRKLFALEKDDGEGKKAKTFRELHLVLGRRSSKTVMASVISSYEAYKLMIIGEGNPHKFYGLPEDDEIAIINVALSQNQAGRLFYQVQARIRNSPFFANRVAKGTTSEIRLYTDKDLEKKAKSPKLDVPGSILILCGHSNPDTLAGYSAILILFDELAFYDETGKVTGSYFYDRLKPSTAKFVPFGEGRLVEISSPNTTSGIFYDIYKSSKENDTILSFQLPTWCVNPDITYDALEVDRKRNPERFAIEYGAQWAKGGIYGNYFEDGLVERCVRTDICSIDRPEPGINYYLHIDPAKNGDRYVALLVGKYFYVNSRGQKRIKVRLANIWVWDPKVGFGLMFNEIDKEVIQICGRYHPMTVTYDQYNSVHSLQLLRSHGINARQTSYNRAFKNKIYQNLKDMMSYQPVAELEIYDDVRLILEMKALKYRPTARGISLVVDKHGDVATDDIIDCLAGAAASASESLHMALPAPAVVDMGWR